MVSILDEINVKGLKAPFMEQFSDSLMEPLRSIGLGTRYSVIKHKSHSILVENKRAATLAQKVATYVVLPLRLLTGFFGLMIKLGLYATSSTYRSKFSIPITTHHKAKAFK